MNRNSLEYDFTDQDTCTNKWILNMKQESGDQIIESIEIEKSRQGCVGHPKTIMALVRNIPVKDLDIDALSQTTCNRSISCGMAFASCLSAINESKREVYKAD